MIPSGPEPSPVHAGFFEVVAAQNPKPRPRPLRRRRIRQQRLRRRTQERGGSAWSFTTAASATPLTSRRSRAIRPPTDIVAICSYPLDPSAVVRGQRAELQAEDDRRRDGRLQATVFANQLNRCLTAVNTTVPAKSMILEDRRPSEISVEAQVPASIRRLPRRLGPRLHSVLARPSRRRTASTTTSSRSTSPRLSSTIHGPSSSVRW
jgi:hypothetical protein